MPTTTPSSIGLDSTSADEIFATGLRNQWYAVCPSEFVPAGGMRRVTRLGRDWVLFRRGDGTVHMLADRCPHRGARLSQGKHLGDRIACWYHGVQVDGQGTVTSVPGLPGCTLEGRTLVQAPPVTEVGGAILAYFGDSRNPEPCELTLPEPLTDPDVTSFLCYAEWNANWRWGMENLLDPMHGSFLHRDSHSMFAGETTAKFRIRETGRGFFFEKTDQRGVNFDWVELCRTGVDWVDLEIPYPPTAGPGGPFGIVGMVTPIDADRSVVFFWRYRKVQGWERDVWRFLYRTTLEPRHWEVLEQDRLVLEALPADADQAENLYQHDLGVVRVRRMYRAEAEKQAAAAVTP
ncbi:Rieske 2Fe-2S domain-containing protein [Streptacidiphilus sp. MAP5-3]|uniref:Rieske 2Fe-2S domain-containing protein n=1 Tax=unclassified Streptacidiphilus TaxID=2643834 RepID=UPI003512A1D5